MLAELPGEAWSAFGDVGAAAATAAATVAAAMAYRSKSAAERAEQSAKPVSNGWTASVTNALDDIRKNVVANRGDISEVRRELADDRKAFIEHLRDHTHPSP